MSKPVVAIVGQSECRESPHLFNATGRREDFYRKRYSGSDAGTGFMQMRHGLIRSLHSD